jgi:vacuolar-type H+-ATPase subunit H
MKILKSFLLSLVIATSLGAISTSAFAGTEDRITYAPEVAMDNVINQIAEAETALNSVTNYADIDKLIKASLDKSKEINANDKVDRMRSSANKILTAARELMKKDKSDFKDVSGPVNTEVKNKLVEASKAFADLKKFYLDNK